MQISGKTLGTGGLGTRHGTHVKANNSDTQFIMFTQVPPQHTGDASPNGIHTKVATTDLCKNNMGANANTQ
eukprot:1467010-Amphidinium_carterae.1